MRIHIGTSSLHRDQLQPEIIISEVLFSTPRPGPGRAIRAELRILAQHIRGLGRVDGIFGRADAEDAGFDMNGGVSESDDDHDRRASALDSDSEVAAAHLQARRTAAVSGAIAGEWAGLPLARDDPINGRTFDFSSVEVKLKEFHRDASQGPGQGAAACGLGAADGDASRC